MRKIVIVIICILLVQMTLSGVRVFADNIQAAFNAVNIAINEIQIAKVGQSYILDNGTAVPFSILYKGTTYLPLRKVSELLDLEIGWNGLTSTASITKPQSADPGWLTLTQEEKATRIAIAEEERVKAEAALLAAKQNLDKLKLEEQRKLTEGVVLFEDSKVKIAFKEATADGIYFWVENKTDIVITIQADALALNGLDVGYIMMSDDVSPQSKGIVLARVTLSNTNVVNISGQLRVIDFNYAWDSYDATFVNKMIK